jgi:hypothetical protein
MQGTKHTKHTMNTPNTPDTPSMNPRLQAVLTIARVRGYKEVSERQMALIHELLPIQELSPSDIVNEVLDAPKERLSRTAKAARTTLAGGLSKLAKALEPQS